MNSAVGNGHTISTVQGVDMAPEDHQALEQIRHGFNNLTRSIETTLMRSFLAPTEAPKDGSGIPPWSEINAAQRTITGNLQALQNLVTDHSTFLKSAHVHPNASFPWSLDGMNAQLLRKRLNPEVENWADKRRKIGKSLDEEVLANALPLSSDAMDVDSAEGMANEDWGKLWDWAAPEASEIARRIFPELDPEYEGDEDEGDDDMEGLRREVVPPKEPMPLDDMMKFMTAGVVGANRGGR